MFSKTPESGKPLARIPAGLERRRRSQQQPDEAGFKLFHHPSESDGASCLRRSVVSRIAHDLPALYVRNTHTKSPSGSRFILVPVSDSERLFLAVLTLFQCAFFWFCVVIFCYQFCVV